MQPRDLSEDDAHWLIRNAADWLVDWAWPVDTLRLVSHFRRQLSPERAAMLCELLELRDRGKVKFARAESMFFHRRGLEQASDETLAAYKAQRFANAEQIADLCCGIGGDAIALAKVCAATKIVDRCPATLAYASENLRLHGLPAEASVGDVRLERLGPAIAWHFDPDRRPGNSRRSEPDGYEPPLDDFLRTADRAPNGAVKLAPAAELPDSLAATTEREWIGHRRECQQQVAWFGDFARHPGQRCATWISASGTIATLVESIVPASSVAERCGNYLVEPKPPVFAAKLTDCFAEKFQLERVAPGVGYFTCDHQLESPLASVYEVLDEMANHRRTLTGYLNARDLRVVEVKKRGVEIDPAQFRKQLKRNTGQDDVVLVVFPRGLSQRVAVVRPHNAAK